MTSGAATVVAFARADLRLLGDAFRRHRLPEALAAALVREAAKFPDVGPDAALAFALEQRMSTAPIDFAQARGILLIGAAGAGKTLVAEKIRAAAKGRATLLIDARDGLARFRAGSIGGDALVVMEAQGFHPLNPRAATAFTALGQTPGVETIGVISALSDAEDVSDLVAAFKLSRVIVTNLDRTRRLGAVLAAITSGAGLAHVLRGPDAELEGLRPGALAETLLAPLSH